MMSMMAGSIISNDSNQGRSIIKPNGSLSRPQMEDSIATQRRNSMAPPSASSSHAISSPITSNISLASTSEAILAADASRPLSYKEYPWSSDSYNATQRNLDTWSFFASFRAQLYLLDQKWSYALEGGYSEERKSTRVRSLAKYMLGSILNLGPTFIK